jgi:hypothetical protein
VPIRQLALRRSSTATWPKASRRSGRSLVRMGATQPHHSVRQAGRTIREHRAGILAAIRLGCQRPGRGLNNKIRLIVHRAYGFHFAKAAVAMVLLCCGPVTLLLAHESDPIATYKFCNGPAVSGDARRISLRIRLVQAARLFLLHDDCCAACLFPPRCGQEQKPPRTDERSAPKS